MMDTIYIAICVFLFYKGYLVAGGCSTGCEICSGSVDCTVCSAGYRSLLNICIKCPTGCTHCSFIGICRACSTEYWHDRIGVCKRCATNCIGCTDATHCTNCKAGYSRTWDQCTLKCSDQCDPNGCDDMNGVCHTCIAGYYGEYCHDNCEYCQNGQCERTGCVNGCQQRFYRAVSGSYSSCFPCSSSCSTCLDTKVCSECESDFYIHTYDIDGYKQANCYPCMSHCGSCTDGNTCTSCHSDYSLTQQNTCEVSNCPVSNKCLHNCEDNGNCIGGCEDGWTGQTCSIQCPSQCKKCEQGNQINCTQCNGNYYSTSCNIPCSSGCRALEGSDTCSMNDGACLHGCVDGYWGQTCDTMCNTNCSPTICTQMYGHCNSCNRIFYGDSCENKCNTHCHDDGSSSPVCLKSNGSCRNGCMQGYSGDVCDADDVRVTMTTPTIATTETSTKVTESTAVPTSNERLTSDNMECNTFWISYVIGFGSCLAIGAVVFAIYIARRRFGAKHDPSTNTEYSSSKPETQNVTTSLSVATGLSVVEPSDDHTYTYVC